MKNLIYIAAIFWLMSCSKDDPGPKPITYTDIRGKWTFLFNNLSADFEIVGTENPFMPGEFTYMGVYAGGKFKIDGTTYTTENTKIDTSDMPDGEIGNMLFQIEGGTVGIVLYNPVYTEDFKTISAESYDFYPPGTEFSSTKTGSIIISRK